MLAAWIEILPLFVVRWLARAHCERVTLMGEDFHQARPDVLFWSRPARAALAEQEKK